MLVRVVLADRDDSTRDRSALDSDVIEEVAKDFADQEHQIDEASDMNFTVYVEDKDGKIHEVKFFTEYDPRFEVDSVTEAT